MHLEKYGHGGDLHTAEELFGVQQKSLVDFSANINPLGPPQRVLNLLKENFEKIIHYPDPAHRRLTTKLANRLNIHPDKIIIGNGAAECLSLCILAFNPKKIGVIYPCFSEYEQLAHSFEVNVVACYSNPENNYKPNIGELFQLIKSVDLVFIGHPNNPTGTLYKKEELYKIAIQAKKTNTYLVIDEAFIDFIPNQSLLDDLEQFSHVIVIRSMTKFYAIPGLRLGYAVADKELIIQMKQKQIPWSVNQLALIAGEACLEELEYEEKTLKTVVEQRQYLKSNIEKLFNWTVFPGEANFLLVRLPNSILAEELQMELGKKGILIRLCSMYPGLTDQDFRIAVRSKYDNERLIHALTEVLEDRWN